MRSRGQITGWACLGAGLLALLGNPALAYYHFVHYTAGGAIQDRFDLRLLPNKTVTFFVADSGVSNTIFSGNDTFNSALTQIRQAALAWNGIDTSDLRVAFGGLESYGTNQSTPAADIIFEDMPPGVLAFTGHTQGTGISTAANGSQFVPITRSLVHLSRDFSKHPGPSYSELFYTTVVHEMGHALGLQHTFTGSAMSTYVTRATSRAKALDRDDIAGISLLYPKNGNFVGQFGSISGHVYSGGQAIHLASVVAIRPNGSAVSTLSNLDGSYRIDGLQPGYSYWVYVHPLPPDADIRLPVDANGNSVQASGPTETLFWSGIGGAGTRDPSQFGSISITAAGQAVSGIDFSVQSRSAVSIYDISSYGYFGQAAVSPAYISSTSSTGVVVTQGIGITSGSTTVPGLGVQLLGGFAPPALTAYGNPTALAIYVGIPIGAGTGPRHLLFTLPNDAYVLPSAVILTQKAPPAISGVTSNPDGTVTITGTSLQSDSRVFFDGQPAAVTTPFAGNDADGSITVQPPPGTAGQTATLAVYNSDGQNSTFQGQTPQTYTYSSGATPISAASAGQLVFNPTSLPAGTSSMVDVIATGNMRFADGQVTVSFGSSDLSVRDLWVMSPTHVVVNLSAAANAALGASSASVISGSQVTTQPSAFVTLPQNAQLPALALPLVNANPLQTTFYPGAVVSLFGSNLAVSSGSAAITIGGQTAPLLFTSANQINFQIPATLGTGPAILNLNNGTTSAAPIVVQIDKAPPTIIVVTSSNNSILDSTHPAVLGDTLQILVAGLDPTVLATPSRVRVNLNGVDVAATSIQQSSGQSNVMLVQFYLPPTLSGLQTAQVYLLVDGSASNPVTIALRTS